MLPTDWSAPGNGALHRLDDHRVRQFWDPNHMVAAVLGKAEKAGQLHPKCCVGKGFLWDLNAAYAPGSRWPDNLPQPVVFDGPVVRTISGLDAALAKSK